MPIEIRELVIRAVVDSDRSPGDAAADDPPVTQAALVAATTKAVLDALRRQRER